MSLFLDYNDSMLSSDDDSEYTVAYTPTTEEFPPVSILAADEDEYINRARMMTALQEVMGLPVKHRIDMPNGAYRIVTVHSFQRPPVPLSILQLDTERARAQAEDLANECSIHRARVEELRASNIDLQRDISDVRTEMQLLARAKVSESRDLTERLEEVHEYLRVMWRLYNDVFVAIPRDRDRAREQHVYVLEGERLLEELVVKKSKAQRDYDAAKRWKEHEEQQARKAMAGLTRRILVLDQNKLALEERLRTLCVESKRTREVLEKREREIRDREKRLLDEDRLWEMADVLKGLKKEIDELRGQLRPKVALEKRRKELMAALEVPTKLKERCNTLKEELRDKKKELKEAGDVFRSNQAVYRRTLVALAALEAECQRAEARMGEVEERNLAAEKRGLQEEMKRAVEQLGKAREEEERVRAAVIKEGKEAKERIVVLRKELAGVKGRVEQARRKVNVWEARSGVRLMEDV